MMISSKQDFLGSAVIKNPPDNLGDARDVSSIPGLGRSPGVGNGNAFPYRCLKNPTEKPGGATVHGAPKTWTRLSE